MKINFARRFVFPDRDFKLLAKFLAVAPRRTRKKPVVMINPQREPLQRVTWYGASTLGYGTARAFLICMRAMNMDYTDIVEQRVSEPRIGRSVSLDHAAEMLGVSRRTIYNRIRDGRLQTIRTVGGSQRVLLESVIDRRTRFADPFRRPSV